MRRLLLAGASAGLVALGSALPAFADEVPAFNPDAVANSGGKACHGQLVAFAVRPHAGYSGHGLAGDVPTHGFSSVREFQANFLRALCS